jgi:dTDP-4-dehydrorhamnose reductase
MNIYITGIYGMLGYALSLRFKEIGFNVSGCDIVDNDYKKIDLLKDFEKFEKDVKKNKPSVLVHTVSMINIDECEEKTDFADEINVNLTERIANFCKENKIKMVYISSAAVYNMVDETNQTGRSSEKDKPDPQNYYSNTKLLAEEKVLNASKQNLILRLNIFGWNKQEKVSFAEFVYNSIRHDPKVDLMHDYYFSPVYTETIADIIKALIENKQSGIFNVGCQDRISKYDFGVMLCDVFGFSRSGLNKISINDGIFKVKRSSNIATDQYKLAPYFNTPSIIGELRKFRDRKYLYKE